MEEDQAPKDGTVVSNLITKFGLPTALLLICGYLLYSDVIKPLAGQYSLLLNEVRLNNTEIKSSLLLLGEKNAQRISKLEDQILKNSEAIESGLSVIARENKDELLKIETKIDRILEGK